MLQKILHTDFYAWSYELLQIICVLPTAAVVFALLFMDTEVATWYIMFSLLGDACLLLGIYFCFQKYKKREKTLNCNYVFLVFLIWTFLSSMLAADRYVAFYSTSHRGEGFIGLLIYAGIYLCGMQIMNEERRWKLLRLFMSGSPMVCFLYLLQKSESVRESLGFSQNMYLLVSEPDSGVFLHFNHYGYYLTMVIVCAAGLFVSSQQWKDRMYALIIFLVNTTVLIANNTFGCYLATMVGLIAVAVLLSVRNRGMNRRTLLPLLFFLGISYLYNLFVGNVTENFAALFHDTSVITSTSASAVEIGSVGTGRGSLWRQTLVYIRERPFVGYGSDGLVGRYEADGFLQDRPANEYLQYAAFYGIPALLLYLSGIVLLFFEKIKKFMFFSNNTIIIGCIVVAYMISGFFGNTAFYTTSFFFLFLGMIAGENADTSS